MLPLQISRSGRTALGLDRPESFSRRIPQYLNNGPHFKYSCGLNRVGARIGQTRNPASDKSANELWVKQYLVTMKIDRAEEILFSSGARFDGIQN